MNGFLANKMYKASIIKRNNYYLNEKIFVSEDLLFNLYYFDSCKKIVYDSSYCYFYRQHNTSAYNNLKNKKWFTVLDAYSLMLNKEKKNDQIYDEIVYNFGLTILEAKYRLDYLDYIAKEEKINLKLRLRKLEKMYVPFNRYIHLKFFLYKFFPKLIIFYKKRKMKG